MRSMIFAVVLCLTATVCQANVTPSGNKILGWANNKLYFGDEMTGYQVISSQGYTATIYSQDTGNNATTLTLTLFIAEIKKGYATIDLSVDGGSGNGICVALYDTSQAGKSVALAAANAAVANGVCTPADVFVQKTQDGWGIFIVTSTCGVGMSAYYKAPSAGGIVFMNACRTGMSLACLTIAGAAFAIGNPDTISSEQAVSNANTCWGRMNGTVDQGKRSAGAAVSGLKCGSANLSTSGNGSIVLAPTVTVDLAQLDDGTIAGTLTFDCAMDRSGSVMSYLSASGSSTCSVNDATWPDDHTILFNYTACGTCGCQLTASSSLKSETGNHYLDGNGEGPNNDDFVTEINPNLAAAFGRIGAFSEGSGVRVFGVVRHPDPNTVLEFYSGDHRQELLGRVSIPVAPVKLYSQWAPGFASTMFEVVARSPHNPTGVSSRLFGLGDIPSDWAALHLAGLDEITDGDSIPGNLPWWCDADGYLGVDCGPPPPPNPPPHDTLVTDLVFVTPRSDLLPACDSVINWWSAHGVTSQKVVAKDGSAYSMQTALKPIWVKAQNTQRVRVPLAVLVGNHTVFSGWHFPDSTGESQTDLVSYYWITDFDGDGKPNWPLTRVFASTSTQVTNQAATATWWQRRYIASEPQRTLVLSGDIPGSSCDVISGTVNTACDAAIGAYNARGITTRLIRDSDYACSDYITRNADAVACVDSGLTELTGHGMSYWDRSNALVFQRQTAPLFTASMLTKPQAIIAVFPSCDLVNLEADTTDAIVNMLLQADVTRGTAITAAVGAGESGNELDESRLWGIFVDQYRFAADSWCLQEAYWRAVCTAWDSAQTVAGRNYLRTATAVGFPAPLLGNSITAVQTSVADARDVLTISPNPFHDACSFTFALTRPTTVQLAVFDTRGRLVTTLLPTTNPFQPAGAHVVSWKIGHTTTAGVYYARLTVEGTSTVRKLVLLR